MLRNSKFIKNDLETPAVFGYNKTKFFNGEFRQKYEAFEIADLADAAGAFGGGSSGVLHSPGGLAA